MKKLYLYITLIVTLVGLETFASNELEVLYGKNNMVEISDIYIEAHGNNKYEAKIKAHEFGMRRAVLIVADKLGIPSSSIKKIPYIRLKEALYVSWVNNEKETDEAYSAVVNYKYDLYSINKLLLDYGGVTVDNKFYEYLVLPIFKQKNTINIWDETIQWNNKWGKSRNFLEQNKILYPAKNSELIKVIRSDNIFDLSYTNFLEIFQPILIKKVMLLVCEYFTDIDTGKSFMKVDFVIIEQNHKKIIPFEYQINNIKEVPHIIDGIIKKTAGDYGKFVDNPAKRVDKEESILGENIPTKHLVDDTRTIMLNSYIYDDEEFNIIKTKLANIKEIESFTTKHDYDRKYKIIIVTRSDDFKLAESFYLNGLSFKKYGNIYNLIDIKEGS